MAISLPIPGEMGALTIGKTETTTFHIFALNLVEVITEKITAFCPLDLPIFTIFPGNDRFTSIYISTNGFFIWVNIRSFGKGFQVAFTLPFPGEMGALGVIKTNLTTFFVSAF